MITLEQRVILNGHSDFVETIAVSPADDTVMTGGRDGKILLWKLGVTEPVFSWNPYNGIELYHSDMSYDTNMILACFSQYKEALVYNRATQQSRAVPLLEHCHCPTMSRDGSAIISYSDRIVYRIHLSEHKGIECVYKSNSPIRFCQYLRDRESVLILNQNGQIQIVDILTKTVTVNLPQIYPKIGFVHTSCDDSFIVVGDKSK